jgi:UPF0716 family protein affecting phage T7 exclusion
MIMNKKELLPPLFAILAGIILILIPFFTDLKKSLILLGIVPLWLGSYFIFHSFNTNKTRPDEEVDSKTS